MPVPVSNPPNPWQSVHVDWEGEPPPARLEVFEETARSILSENDSPDVGFRFSANPYRGCYHGCAYCYARSSHQYLGFGAGTDFERKIVVKTNAVELLREAFDKPSWQGEVVALSGNTDCYQPLEASYRLTRGMLEVAAQYRNPVGIITKSSVIRRDVDVLSDLARDASVRVTLSIAFADDETGRAMEPWASPISRRFETVRVLADAGIPVGVSLAPLIPGLNDRMIPEILQRAHDAGARHAFTTMLRLSGEVLPVFDERIEHALSAPLAKKVRAGIRELRGGAMNDSSFGARMRGLGPRWQVVEDLFHAQVRRLGMDGEGWSYLPSTFRRPSRQLDLF